MRVEPTGSATCPVALVSAFVTLRRRAGAADADLLFVSPLGKPISGSAVSSLVALLAKEAGIDGSFTGHSLRIGGASAALAGGFSADEVKAIGAWKSDAVVRYLRPLQAKISEKLGL